MFQTRLSMERCILHSLIHASDFIYTLSRALGTAFGRPRYCSLCLSVSPCLSCPRSSLVPAALCFAIARNFPGSVKGQRPLVSLSLSPLVSLLVSLRVSLRVSLSLYVSLVPAALLSPQLCVFAYSKKLSLPTSRDRLDVARYPC